MKETILFSETQRFRQWWIWILLLGIYSIFLYGLYVQLITGQPYGDKPMTDIMLVISTILYTSFVVLFLFMRMDTQITQDSIQIRFFPFHRKPKRYSWDSISKYAIRKYNATQEYGGWGIKGYSNDRAYNISGNQGLQIQFRDGHKLLIGTKNSEGLQKALSKINQPTPN